MLNGSLLKQVGAFAQDTWNNYVSKIVFKNYIIRQICNIDV